MNFQKIAHLIHSGQGENAIHKLVIDAFLISFDTGIKHCKDKGFDVKYSNGVLTINQKGEYGFQMTALTKYLVNFDETSIMDAESGMLFDKMTYEIVGQHNY